MTILIVEIRTSCVIYMNTVYQYLNIMGNMLIFVYCSILVIFFYPHCRVISWLVNILKYSLQLSNIVFNLLKCACCVHFVHTLFTCSYSLISFCNFSYPNVFVHVAVYMYFCVLIYMYFTVLKHWKVL